MAMSLVQLQMLAQERPPSRHHQLLREIADGLCNPAPAAEERTLLAELLDNVLDGAEPVARQELAERLASRAGAPPRIVVRLANDLIAVAGPLLINSPVLEDDDLAALAAGKSPDHQLAIAKRTQLSARITDVLIARDDALVLDSSPRTLARDFPSPAPPPSSTRRSRAHRCGGGSSPAPTWRYRRRLPAPTASPAIPPNPERSAKQPQSPPPRNCAI